MFATVENVYRQKCCSMPIWQSDVVRHVFLFSRITSDVSSVFAVIARELISRLLQIKMRRRFTADKSLAHDWLQVLVLVHQQSANDCLLLFSQSKPVSDGVAALQCKSHADVVRSQ